MSGENDKKMLSTSELDTVVSREVEKEREKMKAEIRKEIEKEIKKEIKLEQIRKRDAVIASRTSAYLDNTGLTSKKFAERLIKLNIQKKWTTVLRDEHINMTDKSLWQYIRKNWKQDKQ